MKIVYNIYVAVRKLWNAIFGKNGDGSQLVIPGRISGASGDVTVGSGLELGTGDTLNCTVPTPTTVVANPTMAGTESDLTGLQVGDTKYAIPSGGSLYLHTINLTEQTQVKYRIVCTKSTAFTFAEFTKWLYDNGYSQQNSGLVPPLEFFGSGDSTNFAYRSLYATNSTRLFLSKFAVGRDGTTGITTTEFYAITDTVTQI